MKSHSVHQVQVKLSRSQLIQFCESELSDIKWQLATKYWPLETSSCCVTDYNRTVFVEDTVGAPEAKIRKLQSIPKQLTYAPQTNDMLPIEDIRKIKRPSDITKVTRMATRFYLFKDLTDEHDIMVQLDDGIVMRVAYDNIRFVESFLFRMYNKSTVEQRTYMQSRTKPVFARADYYIGNMSDSERIIALFLLSCSRCHDRTLLAFLNLKLHQLSAFTFELIRRGSSMNALVNFYLNEYMDPVERKHIEYIVDTLKQHKMELGVKVQQKWEKQRDAFQKIDHQLLDRCVDTYSVAPRTIETGETTFYREVLLDISSVDYELERLSLINYSSSTTLQHTLCSLVHLTQLSETAYGMSTATLKMAIQRRVDFLTLIIMEHNMRAQNSRLSVGKNFYNLAIENTLLSAELLSVKLYYEPLKLQIQHSLSV